MSTNAAGRRRANEVTRGEVIAFRLGAQHLAERLSPPGLLAAAGACGVQNSPPGSALLALHARVRDLARADVDHAVAEEKSLLQTWSMRGAPFYFPTADAAVFTAGVLPPTEAALRHFIPGIEQSVARLGIDVTAAVELTRAEIGGVLAGRRLAIGELGAELAERITGRLTKDQRPVWRAEGPHAPGQPVGEAVVHFCLRVLALQRVVCFAPRSDNKAPFVLVEEWLGEPVPDVEAPAARAELLRRYLRCYGPASRAGFAAWLGVTVGDAEPWWSLLEGELTRVEFGGASWLLTSDLDALRASSAPQGVRMLPPRDPYTQLRDRATIVDEKYHRQIWKAVGEPGTLLVDGEIVGTWRPRKSGRKLVVTVEAFGPLSERAMKELREEAQHVARLRGAASAAVEFGGR